MPAPSSHFNNLISCHQLLVETYLPDLATAGIPDLRVRELTRAFIALAHAEIEFYFESVCKDVVLAAEAEFKAGRVTSTALGLITFSGQEARNGGEQLIETKKSYVRKVSTRFYDAATGHKKLADENHGIRQKYLAPLFVPLGLTQQEIDPIWIAQIDSFADKRGSIAHKSMTVPEAEPKNLNPNDEALRVHRLIFDDPKLAIPGVISSIESFDKWAQSLTVVSNGIAASHTKPHSSIFRRALWALVDLVDRWENYRAKRS